VPHKAGRRRQVPAERLEHLADEALRRPVGQSDLAACLADAHQFGGGSILIRREHHAEGGNDHVEARVRKWKRLGIGLAEVDGERLGRGALTAALEQGRHIVGRGDVAPAARGRKRDIAVAGRHVEHRAAGAEVERLAEVFADNLQGGADHRIVAGGPCALLARLDGAEIGLRGRLGEGRCRGHLLLPGGCWTHAG